MSRRLDVTDKLEFELAFEILTWTCAEKGWEFIEGDIIVEIHPPLWSRGLKPTLEIEF